MRRLLFAGPLEIRAFDTNATLLFGGLLAWLIVIVFVANFELSHDQTVGRFNRWVKPVYYAIFFAFTGLLAVFVRAVLTLVYTYFSIYGYRTKCGGKYMLWKQDCSTQQQAGKRICSSHNDPLDVIAQWPKPML